MESYPNRDTLVHLYYELYDEHPHRLLPLETELPRKLQADSRDQYRIIMTMILSERSDDYKLSKALGRLFHICPDFNGLRFLSSKQQIIERILAARAKGGCGFGGYNKPNGGGNDDRMSTFLNYYFRDLNLRITEQHIRSLELAQKPSGFGPKFVRTLLAYCPLDADGPADRNVLPLDRPGFEFLRQRFPAYDNKDNAREDIEHKLRGDGQISLIDFHELLRFRYQTGGRDPNAFNNDDIRVVIGWNAWRLLCSTKREDITKGPEWIRDNLVKHDSIAKKLWDFFNDVSGR